MVTNLVAMVFSKTTGGLTSKMLVGKFGHGFTMGVFNRLASASGVSDVFLARLAVSGMGSALGSGKFLDGVIFGAWAYDTQTMIVDDARVTFMAQVAVFLAVKLSK